MERPRGDAHSYELSRLKELRAIHKRQVETAEDVARNLREEAQIWKDILPGYKIKEMTDDDKAELRSKEVRGLHSVEQTMLQHYRKFLGNLVALAHRKSEDIQHIVMSCLCDMLPQAQDFNFGSSVIDIVVDRANSKYPRVAAMCIAAVRRLLSAPAPSEAVLACLQCVSDQVKERGEGVSQRLVASLLCVRIKLVNVNSRDLTKEAQERKKRRKQDKDLAKAVDAADATGGKLQQARLQTNMLQKVITTYLRVLDTCRTASRYRQSVLLGPTMEGLSKFAHLIDYSLFDLLLKAIRNALDSPATTIAATLHGIITVATLAQQHQQNATAAEGVSVDISPYYEDLYRVLPDALGCSSHHDDRGRVDEDKEETEAAGSAGGAASVASTRLGPRDWEAGRNTLKERTDRAALVLRACDLLLLQPKRLPLPRVAAFCRRLALLAVHSPPNICISLLAVARALCSKYPRLLDTWQGGEEGSIGAAGAGGFNPDGDLPDRANALQSVGWEVCMLPRIYHPFAADYAAAMLKEQQRAAAQKLTPQGQLLGVDPHACLRKYDTSAGCFLPQPESENRLIPRRKVRRRGAAAAAAEEEGDGAPPPEPPPGGPAKRRRSPPATRCPPTAAPDGPPARAKKRRRLRAPAAP